METTIANGPGQLNFWWKVSSEFLWDYLEFLIDGELQNGRISGEVDWEQVTCLIPAGNHVVRWRYAKDAAVSAGQDRGWVDQVAFVPTAVQPPKLLSPRYLAGGFFQCEITGSPGAKYVVLGSTDLRTWVPLATNTAPFTFSEPQPGQFPARMYRARSEP